MPVLEAPATDPLLKTLSIENGKAHVIIQNLLSIARSVSTYDEVDCRAFAQADAWLLRSNQWLEERG